jgi:hypothetical protein
MFEYSSTKQSSTYTIPGGGEKHIHQYFPPVEHIINPQLGDKERIETPNPSAP